MMDPAEINPRNGYCIFKDTLLEGSVPCVSDAEHYIVFDSEVQAQREIADNIMTRIQEFLDGERDFTDAVVVEEFVVPVTVHSNERIVDAYGNSFSLAVE